MSSSSLAVRDVNTYFEIENLFPPHDYSLFPLPDDNDGEGINHNKLGLKDYKLLFMTRFDKLFTLSPQVDKEDNLGALVELTQKRCSQRIDCLSKLYNQIFTKEVKIEIDALFESLNGFVDAEEFLRRKDEPFSQSIPFQGRSQPIHKFAKRGEIVGGVVIVTALVGFVFASKVVMLLAAFLAAGTLIHLATKVARYPIADRTQSQIGQTSMKTNSYLQLNDQIKKSFYRQKLFSQLKLDSEGEKGLSLDSDQVLKILEEAKEYHLSKIDEAWGRSPPSISSTVAHTPER